MITNTGCKFVRDLKEEVDRGGSGSGVDAVIVTYDTSSLAVTCNKTFNEIKNMWENAKPIVFYFERIENDLVTGIYSSQYWDVYDPNGEIPSIEITFYEAGAIIIDSNGAHYAD